MPDVNFDKPGFFGRIASGMKYVFTGRNDFFGPGTPLPTAVSQEAAKESGLEGRFTDYTTWQNLQRFPRAEEPISYAMLRSLADNYDILRLVIETRKDQICKLKQKIVAKKDKKVPAARLEELNNFFKRPDREHTWSVWLRSTW